MDRRYELTVIVRFDCPTVTIAEHTKYCTHNSNSAKRQNGQLVRKLFQPEELSTVMQKETEEYLCSSNRLCNKSKTIRLDTDASRLCAIIKM